jgi:hypothetical protein
MVSLIDIGWLAGFIEGEGTIDASRRYGLVFATTDADVAARAVRILGGNLNGPYRHHVEGRKPFWRGTVHGSKAAGWCMTLYPLMGERRRAKIREWLRKWREAPGSGRKEQSVCGRGHDLTVARRYYTPAGHLRRTCPECRRQWLAARKVMPRRGADPEDEYIPWSL